MSRRRGRPGGKETGWVKEKQVHGGTGESQAERKHSTSGRAGGGSGTVCKVPTSENPGVLRNGRRTTGVSGMEKKKQELIF